MMITAKTAIVLIVVVLSGIKPIKAQFEDLDACLTQTDFIMKFGVCFVDAITEPFDLSPRQSDNYDGGARSGRKLQSFQSDLQLSSGAKKYYIDMKMEQAGLKHNKIFDDMKKLGKLWSIGQRDETLSEKIRAFNLRQLIGEQYMIILNEHLGEILELIGTMRQYEVDSKTETGNNDVIDNLEQQEARAIGDTLKCLATYPEAAFEDNLDWLQCFVSCDNLGPVWTCATEAMKTMGEPCSNVVWFADAMVAVTASFLNKSNCDFVVEEVVDNAQVRLTEGGPNEYVNIRSYLPPGVLCIGPDPLVDPIQLGLAVVGNIFGFNVTCDVEFQLTTSNWMDNIGNRFNLGDRAKCRVPGRTLRQVAIGFHDATVNNSGVFKVTDDNWNSTYIIPLVPVVDHRVDGDTNVSFTVKMFVQQEMRGETVKLNVEVIDTDEAVADPRDINAVECYSINDPHIMTFDGHNYNNFYQGAFYLYKHDEHPYEVQAIFQPCERDNDNGTCNCAVAVRSGDDVLVVDRCRRCPGDVCDVNLAIVLYTNGALTTGTRVFRMDGGLRHDIVLPHGTIVKIISSNDLLNVWIMPGSYDYNKTTGLCGTYNDNSSDDLTMPDGSLYTGPGDRPLEQPREFNEAWRVPTSEQIFYGAKPETTSFTPLETCVCTHILMSGAQCDCGRGTATELCNLFMENEYTADNISSIMYPSINNGSDYLHDIDLDVSYVPEDLSGWPGVWNETSARDFCEDLITNSLNPIIEECRPIQLGKEPAIDFCVQDIQILDNTNWQQATIDNVMFRCFNEMIRDVKTRYQDFMLFPNSSCVNQCNDNGICDNGVCSCNDGFYGADCQPKTNPQPYLSPKKTQLCDNRQQLCHFATIFGHNFPEDGTMICQIKNVEISPEGVDYLPKRYEETWEKIVIVINTNQAVCPLPGNGSYEVHTVWDDQPSTASLWSSIIPQRLMAPEHTRMKRTTDVINMKMAAEEESIDVRFIFIAYDSACYKCSAETQSCVKKTTSDHCWINSTCWAPGDTKPNDPCRFCSPNKDMADWTMSDATDVCVNQLADEEKSAEDKKEDMILRGAVGGSISAIVVLIVIILFCVTRKKERAAAKTEEERRLKTPVEPKLGTVFFEDGSDGYENLGRSIEEYDDHTFIKENGSIGGPSRATKTRVEVLRDEERPIDSHSITSVDSNTHKTAL